jgi:hypothetical protein
MSDEPDDAVRLDDVPEAGDVEGVIACFDPECEIELLGVQLRGRSTGAGKNHIVEEGRNLGH